MKKDKRRGVPIFYFNDVDNPKNIKINKKERVVEHPEFGMMRQSKNGWLHFIDEEEHEELLEKLDSGEVLEREYEEWMKVCYRNSKKEEHKSKLSTKDKKKVQCFHCKRMFFPKHISDFKGKKTCDECLRNNEIMTVEEDNRQLKENFRNGIHLQSSMQLFSDL